MVEVQKGQGSFKKTAPAQVKSRCK